MRLYYFTTAQFGLETIRDSRLKIARINESNDPFEFQGLALKRKDRRAWNKLKDKMGERFGLICMSQDWRHPMLWGHYADKHQGLCLGFDVTEKGMFRKVDYFVERPTLNEFGRKSLADLDTDKIIDILFMKFAAWSYETEYRAVRMLEEEEHDLVNDRYFLPLSRGLNLVQVIVGARSLVTRDRLAGVLGSRKDTVTSFKTRAGFRDFEVIENKLKKAWR